MSFRHYQKASLAGWLWYAILAIVSRVCLLPGMQAVNKRNLWQNNKAGLASWLLWLIIIIVLIALLILALRFLFNVI